MAYLIDCPTCARLIRGEEDACPFCGATFRLPGTSTYVRAFGLVLGLMTASCGGDKPDDSTTLMTGAIYSASGFTTTETGTSTGTGTGTGTESSGATSGVTDEPPGTASAAYAASSSATTDESSGTGATGTGTDATGTGTGSTGTGTGTGTSTSTGTGG